MAKKSIDYDILDCAADEPIVFTGTPGRMRGRLPLHNAGEGRAVLRHVRMSGGDLDSPSVGRVATTVLRPHDTARVSARVAISPFTPPGEYRTEVEIGGSVRPAVLRVVEQIHIRVAPAIVFVSNKPFSKITMPVVIDNRSPVPVPGGHPGGIALDDERGECRVTRATYDVLGRELDVVAEAKAAFDSAAERRGDAQDDDEDDEEPLPPQLSLERTMAEWVRQGHHHLSTTGPLGVRNASGVTTIPAGGEAAIDLTFRVPSGLDQHTRYVGVYPFYDADLVFVIVPSPNDDSN